MKNIFRYIFTFVLGGALMASCYDDGTDYSSTETRITIFPEIPVFNADGTTPGGEESYTGAITVFNGVQVSDMAWNAEPVEDKGWAELSEDKLKITYTDYKQNGHDVEYDAINVKLGANHNYRRTYEVLVTTTDGTSEIFKFVQLGDKADAVVTTEVKSVDIPATGGETSVIEYVTNMDTYSYSIQYEGAEKDWLEVVDKGLGKVALKAQQWTNKEAGRSAVLTITVGSEKTSLASVDIPVNQLKNDIFYYAFGPSINASRTNAIQMTKQSDGVYSLKHFVFDAGRNYICFNRNTREEVYPCWCLAADGTVKETGSAVSESDFNVSQNGVYTLTVDFNNMRWTLDRSVKIASCMPDEEWSKYEYKAYPTRDGGVKVWMTTSLHWDGGPSMKGVKYGSGIPAGHGAGAYAGITSSTIIERNPANETVENGGTLPELMCKDGVTTLASKYGRIYSQTEMYTGKANGGLERCQWVECAWGQPGDQYTDDAGVTMPVTAINDAKLATYPATPDGDAQAEQEHPFLKVQIQGLCPFGWHVANMQDWRDLIYATSQDGATDYPVPEEHATYGNMAKILKVPNVAAHLYGADWPEYSTLAEKPSPSTVAAEFGWNLFPCGWRLLSSGYAYGPDDTEVKPGFLCAIPLMVDSAGVGKKQRSWRVVVTGQNNILKFMATNVIGEASATSFRCVKNYNTEK